MQKIGYLMLDNVIGSGTAAIIALVLLPSLASDEVVNTTAQVLRGVGQATTR